MMRTYRIAMVAACPFPYPRGTPIRIYRIADELARRGHEVHVVTYHLGDAADTSALHVHRIRRIPTYNKLTPGPTLQKLALVDLLLTQKLSQVLRLHPFDVVHAHHFEGMLAALRARRRQRLPIVFDVHTLLEDELPFFAPKPLRAGMGRLGRLFDSRLPRRADHTVAVADAIKNRLLEMSAVAEERVSVIPSGVEVESFDGRLAAVHEPNHSSVRRAVFTGNLAAYQGIELMLRAFSVLCQRRQDVRLQIVSRASFAEYRTLAKTLGILERVDLIDAEFEAVPDVLAAADVALNPRTECAGLPQKLLNYMAAGKPIVSFAGSARHLTHGKSALLVENGDTDSFADAMDRILSDGKLAADLGRAARQYVDQHLSWTQTAERIEQVYGHLCNAAKPHGSGAS